MSASQGPPAGRARDRREARLAVHGPAPWRRLPRLRRYHPCTDLRWRPWRWLRRFHPHNRASRERRSAPASNPTQAMQRARTVLAQLSQTDVESGKAAIVPEDEALTRAIGRFFRRGKRQPGRCRLPLARLFPAPGPRPRAASGRADLRRQASSPDSDARCDSGPSGLAPPPAGQLVGGSFHPERPPASRCDGCARLK